MNRWSATILILLVIVLMIVFAAPAKSSTEYGSQVITVHYGDTLTGYAREYAPHMDTREYVDKVKEMNGLTSGMIYAGEDIVVLKEVGR